MAFHVTARVGRDILRVDSYCGARCAISAHNQRVREQLASQSLEENCAALAIELHVGVLDRSDLERLTEL